MLPYYRCKKYINNVTKIYETYTHTMTLAHICRDHFTNCAAFEILTI